MGCSVTCEHCSYAAGSSTRTSGVARRRLMGPSGCNGLITTADRCRRGFLPYDEALGLTDEVSPGLMPLVCLAGTLLPFAVQRWDLLQRFAGVRLSASTVLRDTEGEGERLRAAEGGADGRADAGGALLDRCTRGRPTGRPTSAWMRSAYRCKASGRAKPAPHALHRLAVCSPGKEHTPCRFRT